MLFVSPFNLSFLLDLAEGLFLFIVASQIPTGFYHVL